MKMKGLKFFFFSLLWMPSIFSHEITLNHQLQSEFIQKEIDRVIENGTICDLIQQRKESVLNIKNHWKEKLDNFLFSRDIQELLDHGKLYSTFRGRGSSYFLCDPQEIPFFVIKPFDEDIFCLNNPKKYGSPFNNAFIRVRENIPLYRSAQAEALSYEIALLMGFGYLTPETHLAILNSKDFFNISDGFAENPPLKKEKLCSVQRFYPDLLFLKDLIQIWKANDCLNNEILLKEFNYEDYENLFLLICLFYDTDAHPENVCVSQDENGQYHLFKIDNGLTFPETNKHLFNCLKFFPQAQFPLSERIKEIIKELPVEQMKEKILYYEMENTLDAFLERISSLQNLCEHSNITFEQMDAQLCTLTHRSPYLLGGGNN